MPGNTGDTKQTVRIPALYTCFIAAIRCSMLEAESISFLKFSSSVLIDHETVTRPSFFNRSISRTTRSDFVQIRILPFCLLAFEVHQNCSWDSWSSLLRLGCLCLRSPKQAYVHIYIFFGFNQAERRYFYNVICSITKKIVK